MSKVLVAMSGGVDSSVAAYLIQKQGYECVGCTMKLYNNEDIGVSRSHTCCTLEDVEDARGVTYKLGIPYYVFNFTYDFREKVICKFIRSYESGITPNPCIDCNRFMKFEKLYDRAVILGCNYIATGHYARIGHDGERYILKKAADESKDQSYVLYFLTQKQLERTLFPLGEMKKSEVRRIAEKIGFANSKKPDSQDICFAPGGDYAKIIELHNGSKQIQGHFIDKQGNILGKHKGIINYTLGQRKGLGISSNEPLYVCKICPDSGNIVLGKNVDLFDTDADVFDLNWISGTVPTGEIRCKVKIRYRQPEQWATVIPTGERSAHITFDEPQRAITDGQAAVLYDGDIVLGGGTIGKSGRFVL